MQNIGAGFSFAGIHCDDMHCELANNAECMHLITEIFADQSVAVAGYRGEYYAGRTVKARDFNIEIFVEDVTREQLDNIGIWLGRDRVGKLVFDHIPYKYYNVRVVQNPAMQVYPGFRDSMWIYSGKITIKMKAYDPAAYMIDGLREEYPDIGDGLNTVDSGTGLIPAEMYSQDTGLGNMDVINFGTADARPEIWVTGIFAVGTVIANPLTGESMKICDGNTDGVERTYCVDTRRGVTTRWENTEHPETAAEHAAIWARDDYEYCDNVRSGSYITLKSCYPRYRNVRAEVGSAAALDAVLTEDITGYGILFRNADGSVPEGCEEWSVITGTQGNSVTAERMPPAGEYRATILRINHLSATVPEGDTLTGITVFFRDTFN